MKVWKTLHWLVKVLEPQHELDQDTLYSFNGMMPKLSLSLSLSFDSLNGKIRFELETVHAHVSIPATAFSSSSLWPCF